MDRFRSLITALLLSMVLLPVGATATPADTLDEPTPEDYVQAELILDLTAASTTTQKQAALRIREYAYTHRYSQDFFRGLVEPLHDVVVDGETEDLRLAAMSALSAIGTKAAMKGLKAQVDSFRSERLRAFAKAALAKYEAARTIEQRSRIGE